MGYLDLVRETLQIQEQAASLNRDVGVMTRFCTVDQTMDISESVISLKDRAKNMSALRNRMLQLEAQIVKLLEEKPELSLEVLKKGRVTMMDTKTQNTYPEDTFQLTETGHVPPSYLFPDRPDTTHEGAKQLGGRLVQLQTPKLRLGVVDTILVEPTAMYLNEDFRSLGVVICLHGGLNDEPALVEWGMILKSLKLLDSGLSFAMPEIVASAAIELEDIEVVCMAAMKAAKAETCILLGRGWGGPIATRVAHKKESPLHGRVAGLVLISPGLPAPATEISELEIPIFLGWGMEDEENPFDNIDDWMEAIQPLRVPYMTEFPGEGSSAWGAILAGDEVLAKKIVNFMIAAQIVARLADVLGEAVKSLEKEPEEEALEFDELEAEANENASKRGRSMSILHKSRTLVELMKYLPDEEEEEEGAKEDAKDQKRLEKEAELMEDICKLCDELPDNLARMMGEAPDNGLDEAFKAVQAREGNKKGACEFTVILRSWVRSGMHEVSGASE